MKLPEWKEEKYKHLLTSSICNKSVDRIKDVFNTCKNLGIDNYMTSSIFGKTKHQIEALYYYLKDNDIQVIIDNRLHPVFNVAPSILKKKYGLDLKK